MLYNRETEKSGFRPLNADEIEAVTGGLDGNQIIVPGSAPSGGLSGISLQGFLALQAAFGIELMLQLMEGTTQDAPPDDVDGNQIIVTGTAQLPSSPIGAPIFMIGNVIINPADFNPNEDHCGSSSNNSEWLPEGTVFGAGVDISFACFVHDQLYGPGSDVDRQRADEIFRNHIFNIIMDSFEGPGVSQAQVILAWTEASAAYGLVRAAAGGAYEGNGNPD
ncbi:MAG: hypothetical protein AAF546_06895 [Verrucomicrobiota bacterium]